jgi:protein subunit release factor A
MMYLEVQAAEGGDDAALFAEQLTSAIAKFTGATYEGSALVVPDTYCL